VNYPDDADLSDSDVVEAIGEGAALIKKIAAEKRAALLKSLTPSGDGSNTTKVAPRERSTMLVPGRVTPIYILLSEAEQQVGRSELLDCRLTIRRTQWKFLNDSGRLVVKNRPHPVGIALPEPTGEWAYSPVWYKSRKWCDGDVRAWSQGVKGLRFTYFGSAGIREIPDMPVPPKWPFGYMMARVKDKQARASLREVGLAHRNLWWASVTGRSSRYLGAADALEELERLTGKPVMAVFDAVVLGKEKIESIGHLSEFRNNTFASRELMSILRDGLRALGAHYELTAEKEDATSWPEIRWADDFYIDEDGHEVSMYAVELPEHWTRLLREFKYREERDNREARRPLI